ncbi:MAG TPA: hypothetical protein VJR89_12080 [Polyangiales bacterium]|nr:hypothetical protein [Polyangiales bacterium]
MGSITALLLATPIFGLSLHAPALDLELDLSAKAVAVADVAAKADADEKADSAGGGKSSAEDEYKEQLKTRNSIAGVHRVFGIATWAAMTVTLVAGFIDYNNLYGFGADIGSNPCVEGSAIGGDDFGCRGGFRTIKSAAAYVTTALYATTFTLSLMMPDPDDLASGKGEFASTLRLHKTLRWVHFGGMLTQIALGVLMTSRIGGLDRANDYGTLQALSTVHLATGLITWGALTWAGALMTF